MGGGAGVLMRGGLNKVWKLEESLKINIRCDLLLLSTWEYMTQVLEVSQHTFGYVCVSGFE